MINVTRPVVVREQRRLDRSPGPSDVEEGKEGKNSLCMRRRASYSWLTVMARLPVLRSIETEGVIRRHRFTAKTASSEDSRTNSCIASLARLVLAGHKLTCQDSRSAVIFNHEFIVH